MKYFIGIFVEKYGYLEFKSTEIVNDLAFQKWRLFRDKIRNVGGAQFSPECGLQSLKRILEP